MFQQAMIDQCRFDCKDMEDALKILIKCKLDDENIIMAHHSTLSGQQPKSCPTFVVATRAMNADGPPNLFRSYQCKGYNANRCFIWQAGCATSALPLFFKPIYIDNPVPGGLFIGGGIGHNNPSDLALEEARRIWVSVKRFALVSIGTGRQESVWFINPRSPHSFVPEQRPTKRLRTRRVSETAEANALQMIGEACVKLSRSAEATHQRTLKAANTQDPDGAFPYYRFNVERGMDDIRFHEWYKLQEIGAHTSRYLDEGEGRTILEQCAQTLINPPLVECT
jgi:predicted acylesterase/phospholipase RssA